jgi:hypothetical protein
MRSFLDGEDGTDVKIAADRDKKLHSRFRAQIAPAPCSFSLFGLSHILLARYDAGESRIPRVCELSEASDKLNHWHNCSLNRPEMSPNFQEVVSLRNGLQLAVRVPGNAGPGGCDLDQDGAVKGGWDLMLSNAQLESEKI